MDRVGAAPPQEGRAQAGARVGGERRELLREPVKDRLHLPKQIIIII